MAIPFFSRRYRLEQVFTPSSVAKLTYVKRDCVEADLEKFLQTPGMQIVLYGHSGCGKSTLIINQCEKLGIRYVNTICEGRTTFSEMLCRAFDSLNVYYTSEKTSKVASGVGGKVAQEYLALRSEFNCSLTAEESARTSRVVSVQLSAQRLAEFMGNAGYIWIIEDFHKVEATEKKKIADVLKVFMDCSTEHPNVKVVCIGAVQTARELVELEPNLATRVAEIEVPLMSGEELMSIARVGLGLLNVRCPKLVMQKIVHYSNRLASVCHQICFDICYDLKIYKSRWLEVCVADSQCTNAVYSYVRKNSDTMVKVFERCAASSARRAVFGSFFGDGRESLSMEDIIGRFRKEQIREKLRLAVDELCTADFCEVLRFDKNSLRYSFSSPVFLAFSKMKFAIERKERQESNSRQGTFSFRLATSPTSNDEMIRAMINEMDKIYKTRNELFVAYGSVKREVGHGTSRCDE